MNLPLDPASGQILQQELDPGHFKTPEEAVPHAFAAWTTTKPG